MRSSKILILAGTSEARALANALVAKKLNVISSFAGVTREPIWPHGEIRTGGFGGVAGLVEYILANEITHVIDATHPFAVQMSANAFHAAGETACHLLRMERHAWTKQNDDIWVDAADMADAVAKIPDGSTVLVTTGRKNLDLLFSRSDLSGVIRAIEPPNEILPPNWQMVLDRPPFDLAQEKIFLQKSGANCILTKNAGGKATAAKLSAARQLQIPVFMIARPVKPNCNTVSTVSAAHDWVLDRLLESQGSQDSLGQSTKG